jgi:hypothetical protein
MKLHRLCDVIPDGRGTVYRQGRLAGAMAALLFTSFFGAGPFLLSRAGAPWWITALCAVFGVLLIPIVVSDWLAKLRDTNWIVWLRPDGLWINFRSYQDRGPTDVETVVRLEFAEVAEVREIRDLYYTPSSDGGSVRHSLKSLEITLTHDRTDELAAAMTVDRVRPAPRRCILGVGVTTRPAHFPVSVPAPGRIRLAWRGGTGNWVTPSLKSVLAELSGFVRTADATQSVAADWRDLTEAELDDRILRLVETGDTITAIELLRSRRGLSTTAARQFVDELLTGSTANA